MLSPLQFDPRQAPFRKRKGVAKGHLLSQWPAVAIERRQADIPAQMVIAQEQRWCAPDPLAP